MTSTLIGQALSILNTKPESAGVINSLGAENPALVAKRTGEKTRDLLLQARRFHLGSDVTRLSAMYGFNVDEPISNFLNVAKLPSEKVWIEWPVRDQLLALGIEPAHDVPDFAGALLSRVPNRPSRFMISMVNISPMDHAKFYTEVSPLSIVVDTEKPIPPEEYKSSFDFVQQLSLIHI